MSMTVAQLEAAKARFGELLVEQDKRIERMKAQGDFINYAKLDKIIIGVCGGDGIGPAITGQAQSAFCPLCSHKSDWALFPSLTPAIDFLNGIHIHCRQVDSAAEFVVLNNLHQLGICHYGDPAPIILPIHQLLNA